MFSLRAVLRMIFGKVCPQRMLDSRCDVLCVDTGTLSAGDEAAKAADLQAVDGFLWVGDQSVVEDSRPSHGGLCWLTGGGATRAG